MTTRPIGVYWDSCVFISCIQRDSARFPVLKEIIEEAKSGRVIIVASALAIAETVKLSGDKTKWKEDQRKISAFFENEFIEIVDVTKEIAEDAARIGPEFDLKPADAIHIATALKYSCRCVHTYDGEDRSAARKRYLLDRNGKIGNPPLVIQVPLPLTSETRPLFRHDMVPPPEQDDSPRERRALPSRWTDGRVRRVLSTPSTCVV